MNIKLDHADIVTCHICNQRCPFCVDKFLGCYNDHVKIEDVEKFMKVLRKNTDKNLAKRNPFLLIA